MSGPRPEPEVGSEAVKLLRGGMISPGCGILWRMRHGKRDTFIYMRTGNLRSCQLLLEHAKLETTVRYLGVELDDARELSEQVDL